MLAGERKLKLVSIGEDRELGSMRTMSMSSIGRDSDYGVMKSKKQPLKI